MPPNTLVEITSDTEVEGYMYFDAVDCWVHPDGFKVLVECATESIDKNFNAVHGTRRCKNLGCKGPMCRKVLRDFMRSRNDVPPENFQRTTLYDDLIDRYIRHHHAERAYTPRRKKDGTDSRHSTS